MKIKKTVINIKPLEEYRFRGKPPNKHSPITMQTSKLITEVISSIRDFHSEGSY